MSDDSPTLSPFESKAYTSIVLERVRHWMECEAFEGCEICSEDEQFRVPIASEEETVLHKEVMRQRAIIVDLKNEMQLLRDQFDTSEAELEASKKEQLHLSQQALGYKTKLKDAQSMVQSLKYETPVHPASVQAFQDWLFKISPDIDKLAVERVEELSWKYQGKAASPGLIYDLFKVFAKVLAAFPFDLLKYYGHQSVPHYYEPYPYGYGPKDHYLHNKPFKPSPFTADEQSMFKPIPLTAEAPVEHLTWDQIHEITEKKKAKLAQDEEKAKQMDEAMAKVLSKETKTLAAKQQAKIVNFGTPIAGMGVGAAAVFGEQLAKKFDEEVAMFLEKAAAGPDFAKAITEVSSIDYGATYAAMKDLAKESGVPIVMGVQKPKPDSMEALKAAAKLAFPEPKAKKKPKSKPPPKAKT